MRQDAFSHIRTWIFDLDNTLYPSGIRLFDQIEGLMNTYIMRVLGVDLAQAQELRARYWRDHGTTLAGLMHHHAVDADDFLQVVHDIDLAAISPDPALSAGLAALPGRKIVYTNGSRFHGHNVTGALGITDLFDAIYGIEDANYIPKPHRTAFDRIFARDGLRADTAAMFEDDPRNLEVPHALGLRTVLVGRSAPAPHIHHMTDNLSDFLSRLR